MFCVRKRNVSLRHVCGWENTENNFSEGGVGEAGELSVYFPVIQTFDNLTSSQSLGLRI